MTISSAVPSSLVSKEEVGEGCGQCKWYINGYFIFFDLPNSRLSLSDHLYLASAVERSQPFQDNSYAIILRRLLKGGTISIGRIADSVPGNMDGNGSQQQVPHQLTTNYLPEYFPFSTAANSYMGSFRSGGDGGSLQSVGQSILRPPTLADVSYPRDLR